MPRESSSCPELLREWKLLALLALILGMRLFSLGWPALSDPSESRYADIALQMYRSHDWITPRIIIHGELVPYWGKPPLHFWLTAICFRLFGISEWSARFPSFMASVGMVILAVLLASRLRTVRAGLIAGIILASSGLFFALAGASVTDATLSAATTAAMVSFALAVLQESRGWGMLFFVFLAAGMLIKGPIAIALVVLPTAVWLTLFRQWSLLRNFPWKTGSLLFLAISVPWYVAAELRTPGFLRYFFVNEHILRFLVHNYGDLYGSGHMYPRGTSWFMLLLTFLPWTGVLIAITWKKRRSFLTDRWLTFAWLWGISPALFFMISRQLLATYLLPGFAGLSITLALELSEPHAVRTLRTALQWQMLVPALLLIGALTAGILLDVSLPFLAGMVGLIAAVLIATHLLSARSVAATVSMIAFSCTLLISASLFAFHNPVDDQSSVKPLMLRILKDGRFANRHIVFPDGMPYSAAFYEQKILHSDTILPSRQAVSLRQAPAPDKDGDVFVFRQTQWNRLNASLKGRLIPLYATGHWIACRKRD